MVERIRLIERKDISEEKWAACVVSHPSTASVFAQTWYLDACASPWDALVCGDYEAVLPLFHRRKYGIRYVYPPFFVAQIGILGDLSHAPAVSEWLRDIPRCYRYVELIFNAENPIASDLRLPQKQHQTFLLNLNSPYALLREAYHQNHRRNLKKAEECQLQVVRSVEDREVVQMFRNQWGSDKRVGFREADYERLLWLLPLLRQHNALETWGVTDAQGNICAAAFFPYMYGRYTFLFSGRAAASQQNRAMFFLIDSFVRQHAGQECLLDFNGSNNPQIAQFYHGFGAESQVYTQIFMPFWKRLGL